MRDTLIEHSRHLSLQSSMLHALRNVVAKVVHLVAERWSSLHKNWPPILNSSLPSLSSEMKVGMLGGGRRQVELCILVRNAIKATKKSLKFKQ